MAKLSAHGHEVGRVEFLTYTKAYMADGKVLKNSGFGWKIYGRLKDGVSPQQAIENAKRRQAEHKAQYPAHAAYVRELHSMAGLCQRWKLHAAIQMMPDDYDGVWSECCDGYGGNVSASIDEVASLCILYGAAVLEAKHAQELQVQS